MYAPAYKFGRNQLLKVITIDRKIRLFFSEF